MALLWEQMRQNEEVLRFMPIEKEVKKLPKQFLVNVAYSVYGDTFAAWVKQRVEERNAKVTKEKNLLISMDPEVAAAFEASTAVSRKCHSSQLLISINYQNTVHV